LNSTQKVLFGLPTVVRVTKSKNYFVIQCYRHWGLQEVEAPTVSRQSAHEGCKVVSP